MREKQAHITDSSANILFTRISQRLLGDCAATLTSDELQWQSCSRRAILHKKGLVHSRFRFINYRHFLGIKAKTKTKTNKKQFTHMKYFLGQ